MRNLKTHEIKRKAREDRERQKEVSVALKTSPTKHKKKGITTSTVSEDDEQDDEEPILIVKNMRRMHHKRGNQREKW